jgi:hypothetical protein
LLLTDGVCGISLSPHRHRRTPVYDTFCIL